MARTQKFFLCTVFLLCFSDVARAQDDVFPGPYVAGAVVELQIVQDQFTDRGDGKFAASFSVPGAESVRVRLTVRAGDPKQHSVMVRDDSGTIRETFALASGPVDQSYWTVPVLGPRVEVVIDRLANDDDSVIVVVDKISADLSNARVESPVGRDDLQPIAEYAGPELAMVTLAQRAVGKLTFVKKDVGYDCTAFMVSDDIAMTNEHCVADEEVCHTAVVTFGYQFDEARYLQIGENFRCINVIDHDVARDFSLIRLAGSPGLKFGKLRLAKSVIGQNTDALIIQHPDGRPKMISAIQCVALSTLVKGRPLGARQADSSSDDNATDYAHTCDTAGGSSGSPVISYAGEVIALHHFGRSRVDADYQDVNRAVAITAGFRKRLADDGIQ